MGKKAKNWPLRTWGNPSEVFLCVLVGVLIGCDTIAPSTPGGTHSLRVGADTRTYEMALPLRESEDGAGAALVLVFHGTGGSGEQMRANTRFDEVVAEENVIVAFPDGVGGEWNDGRPGINESTDDIGFVDALIDEISRAFRIDPNRIYATGLSNGGHFCFRLAFDRPGKFAAIAPVAAWLSTALAERNRPADPIPLLIIGGDNDPITPYAGGLVGGGLLNRGTVFSADATLEYWTRTNRCLPNSAVIDYNLDEADDGMRPRRTSLRPAFGGAPLTLITVEEGGHAWPGGEQYLPPAVIGRTTSDFSASRLIWEFLRENRLNTTASGD